MRNVFRWQYEENEVTVRDFEIFLRYKLEFVSVYMSDGDGDGDDILYP